MKIRMIVGTYVNPENPMDFFLGQVFFPMAVEPANEEQEIEAGDQDYIYVHDEDQLRAWAEDRFEMYSIFDIDASHPQTSVSVEGHALTAIWKGGYKEAKKILEEHPTAELYVWRRDMLKMAEIITDMMDERKGDEHLGTLGYQGRD